MSKNFWKIINFGNIPDLGGPENECWQNYLANTLLGPLGICLEIFIVGLVTLL